MQSCSHICPIERKRQLLRVPLLESKPTEHHSCTHTQAFLFTGLKEQETYLLTLLPEFQLAPRDGYWYHLSLQTLQEKMI